MHLDLPDFGARVEPAQDPAFEVLDAAAQSAPKLALRGEVVTMAGSVVRHGVVYIEKGVIVAVQDAAEPAPAGFAQVRPVATDGVIYPGLADLHNHLPYNVLSLWWPRV